MGKSADAFRTISEVADWLDTPAHVLRFWESKFTQVKPVKRAGGRRYYRPSDMQLLGGIKKLLHGDGMTIKGVQKLLRESGVKHVAALSPQLDGQDTDDVVTAVATEISLKRQDDPADSPARLTPVPEEPDAETVHDLAASAPDEASDKAETSPADTAPDAELPLEMPRFSHRQVDEPEQPQSDAAPVTPVHTPIKVDIPDDPDDDTAADAGILSRITTLNHPLPKQTAVQLAPILIRLREITADPNTPPRR